MCLLIPASRNKTIRTEYGCSEGSVFLNTPQKTLKLTEKHLVSIESTQDKLFSSLLFNVLFTIIPIMSSMILKLHMRLVIFVDMFFS